MNHAPREPSSSAAASPASPPPPRSPAPAAPSPSSRAPSTSAAGPQPPTATASTSTSVRTPSTAPAAGCDALRRLGVAVRGRLPRLDRAGVLVGGRCVPAFAHLRHDVGDRVRVAKALTGLGRRGPLPVGRPAGAASGSTRSPTTSRAGLLLASVDPHGDVQRRPRPARRRRRLRQLRTGHARCAVPAPRVVEPRRWAGRRRAGRGGGS